MQTVPACAIVSPHVVGKAGRLETCRFQRRSTAFLTSRKHVPACCTNAVRGAPVKRKSHSSEAGPHTRKDHSVGPDAETKCAACVCGARCSSTSEVARCGVAGTGGRCQATTSTKPCNSKARSGRTHRARREHAAVLREREVGTRRQDPAVLTDAARGHRVPFVHVSTVHTSNHAYLHS